MGISLSMIDKMQDLGLFGKGRLSVLDVGSSNLYSAPAAGILHFLKKHGIKEGPDVAAFAERIYQGSAYDNVSGGLNAAFVGELFEKAGFRYNAIDIADGYRTTIVDLNHDPVPKAFIGAFDLVLNFGTTEHLLNQYNAFKVIHDATKVGGHIVHSLPCVGYSNHGYFTYTPRCMFDLAGYNEYEVVAFWFEGPSGANDLFAPVRDYRTYFPALGETLFARETTESGRKIAELWMPDVGMVVVYRKVKAKPFAGALERSTSVGDVPSSVTDGYESATGRKSGSAVGWEGHAILSRIWALFSRSRKGTARNGDLQLHPHDELPLTGKAAELRDRFIERQLGLEESLVLYSLVVEVHGWFPYDWEYQVLLLGLAREPDRQDLAERLAFVKAQL
jgi:SAM-dependent methyltransferase